MTISVEAFGSERPPSMELIQIRNALGPSIALTPVGARLVEAHFLDRAGDFDDIVTERRYALQCRRDARYCLESALRRVHRKLAAAARGIPSSRWLASRYLRPRTVTCGWRFGRLAKFATSARKETCWLW